MTEVKIEIQDTGMEEKAGSVVYTIPNSGWINLHASTLRPEFDFIGTNHESKKLTGHQVDFVGNRIESKNPPRYNITCNFETTAAGLADYTKVLKLGDSLGLKKIRGGLGSLTAIASNHPTDTEVYVIITSIKPTENLKTANNNISVTISLQQV